MSSNFKLLSPLQGFSFLAGVKTKGGRTGVTAGRTDW